MEIRIHQVSLPYLDPAASLTFYREALGFEVRGDVGSGAMRWLTVGPADQLHTSIVLAPPVTSAGITNSERRTIIELMAKGVYARISLSTTDLLRTFARLESITAIDVIQEPIRRPFGGLDCVFLDPAGNVVRIVEERA